MDYATKELTTSLQKIATKIASNCNEPYKKSVEGHGKLILSEGVNNFLATRNDFQEKTRDVSVGSY